MPWNNRQINQHIRAAKLLGTIKDETFRFLGEKKNVSEYEAMEFVRKKYKERGLWADHDPIIAFGANTSFVHYFPSQYSRKLRAGSCILLDVWARVREKGAPFADLTWMGFSGKRIPPEIEKIFGSVILARNASVRFLRSHVRKGVLPKGREVDAVARDILRESGYAEYFLHGLGHSLGLRSPHGAGTRLSQKKGEGVLERRVGYTIEPGVYVKNRFGVRSEIDFYIDGGKVIITTPVQRTITLVNRK
ncbi:MAG: M24 family metallopeptidase [Nanoarchaeota archaeon]|nr:M24 family metallopeptidase [Nanoarchaeota archaeon]